jgi:single-stranded-DNA-specific exonuclease
VDPTVTLPMQAIAFCQENAFPLLKEKQSVDICYTIEENTHGKNTYTQLEIKDIRKSNK